MANRQRFLDNQNAPGRQHRYRNNWNSRYVERRSDQTRPLYDDAPFAVSSHSKAKLATFMFEQNLATRSGMDQHDKENQRSDLEEAYTKTMNPPPQPSSQRSAGKDVRECPQTPVGRLPLSELLSNGDDHQRRHNVTPVERVLWDNSPLDAVTPSSLPKGKSRKRARSSSPPSSSRKQSSKHFAVGQALLYASALDKALETPKADLVDDLWSRYSLEKSNKRSPNAAFNAQFTPLLHSSSPVGDLSSRENTGLRRAFSCIDWPTSAVKRRKTKHQSISQAEDDLDLPQMKEMNKPAKNRKSRVSLLVEKIHNHFARPIHGPEISSSDHQASSPVSNQGSPAERAIVNIPSQVQVDQVATTLSQTAMDERQGLLSPSRNATEKHRADASSDFDDVDFDVGMMETLSGVVDGKRRPDSGRRLSCGSESLGRGSLGPVQDDPDHSCPKAQDKSLAATAKPPNMEKGRRPSTVLNIDEFSDDEEVTAAELEGVLATYNTQPTVCKLSTPKGVLEQKASSSTFDSTDDNNIVSNNKSPNRSRMESDDEDLFYEDIDYEQIAAEVKTSRDQQERFPTKISGGRQHPVLQRYIINSIAVSEYESSTGQTYTEKVLSVCAEKTKSNKVIALRQAWLDTPCSVGSRIQLVGEFDRYGQCTVNNSQNFLILNPDYLISATVVGDSFTCTRKAVLEDRVKATSDGNQATLYGHMIHEIFQEALKANRWDEEWMVNTVARIATRHLEGLYELNLEYSLVIDQLKARVSDLQAWAEIFVAAEPNPNAVVKDRKGGSSYLCVNKLLEVEEKVWSPMFGLKGNIDATVQIKLRNDLDEATLTVPFELKTGKHSNAAHKAQTSLYTLLLSDRYDLNIACGILYYMQTSEMSTIRALRHELLPMIMQRNQLAEYIRKKELPPMLRNAYTCGKCFAKSPCFIYHKTVDDGDGETSGVGQSFDDLTGHLKPKHQDFFKKWDSLLTKEEKDIVFLRRELWTMESSEREKTGRCFGGLVIEPDSFHEETEAPKINRFTYRFIKQRPAPTFSFSESPFVLGEPIVVSDENGHFALANGYVTGVRKSFVQITIDRRLNNARAREKQFDPEHNQVFKGIMSVKDESAVRPSSTLPHAEETVTYRLDKDEFSNGMAMVRNNLIKLMEKDLFGVQALRRLIVDGVAPTFTMLPSTYRLIDSASQANLNLDQTAAIEKVMSAKDYALVLGMPGTGKTTTIAYIIRALVAQGKNVLLTSYTHTAVDNILLKLRKDKIGIFRVGALAKIHTEVQEFADISSKPMKTVDDIKRCYSQQVVATTCLGINHPIFNQRIFDYCIVDEASQITLPVCLGPIRMSRSFILVGDHYQLPPLVQNKDALQGGLDISLFKMLSDAHPSSVTNLEHQYRMCSDIMSLSNTLIYKGRLKCGTPEVAARSLIIPDISALKAHHYNSDSVLSTGRTHICAKSVRGACWLRDLLDPTLKACFVNTDSIGRASREVLENGSRITNPSEADLAKQLVESLITTGVPARDIGVITLYRSQLALIKTLLRHRPGVEMHTADRFQGRDKEVIVLSLVRSNEGQIVGDLLKDWRRVNVALTRARTKLLILGSKTTLAGNDLLKDLVSLLESKSGIYDLPARALEEHFFEDNATQISSAMGAMGGKEGNAIAAASAAEEKERTKRIEADWKNGSNKENRFGKKMPAKQAKLDTNRLLQRRPVLRDIVNDAQ